MTEQKMYYYEKGIEAGDGDCDRQYAAYGNAGRHQFHVYKKAEKSCTAGTEICISL